MKTFFNILQSLINVKNKKYPDDPFSLSQKTDEPYTNIKSHICFLINNIYCSEKKIDKECQYTKNASAKLVSLNIILDNSFYEKQLKEDIFQIFSKAQKTYYAFSKLARIYKINKYPFVVTDDLSMNTLDPKHKNTFMLIDNKSKYLFNLHELISIIETAIGNAPDFFSEPLPPLNPYNKQPFTLATLYNIYFKMKESSRLISILFHFFFLENFCSYKFSEYYEYYIRENAIKKYIFNSPYTVLHPHIFIMLETNVYTRHYKIHKDFPKEILVNIFRPFLFYYFIINYDIKGTSKIYNYSRLLFNKLKQFYHYNKAFGRRYIQVTKHFNKIIKKEYKFNTNHITFYGICYNQSVSTNITFNNNINNNTILNPFNTTIFNVYDSDETISDDNHTHNTEQVSNSDSNSDSNSQDSRQQYEIDEQEEQYFSNDDDIDSIS